MESQNSVLINAGLPGQAWEASGGVEESYCIPGKLPKFLYDGRMEIHSDGAARAEVAYEVLMDGKLIFSTSVVDGLWMV